MKNQRKIALEAKDILTVCLAKAIDTALTSQLGSSWFDDFAQEDIRAKVNNRITKTGQTSVRDLDLQALLKFLRYRKALTDCVLAYYGFVDGLDQFAADAQRLQLDALLDRLITDFRNRMEAHSRAGDIEKELSGQEMNRIYGYQEAVQDMCKLAAVFKNVTDKHGVSYYQRIKKLTVKKNKWVAPVIAAGILALILVAGGIFAVGQLWPKTEAPEIKTVFYDDDGPEFEKDELVIQPYHVYYEGDELVVVSYIMNGTEKKVRNIDVKSMTLIQDEKTVAAAGFGKLEDLSLSPNKYVEWSFRFPKDTIFAEEIDFYGLEIKTNSSYE